MSIARVRFGSLDRSFHPLTPASPLPRFPQSLLLLFAHGSEHRMGLNVTLFLSLTAIKFVASQDRPKSSYPVSSLSQASPIHPSTHPPIHPSTHSPPLHTHALTSGGDQTPMTKIFLVSYAMIGFAIPESILVHTLNSQMNKNKEVSESPPKHLPPSPPLPSADPFPQDPLANAFRTNHTRSRSRRKRRRQRRHRIRLRRPRAPPKTRPRFSL